MFEFHVSRQARDRYQFDQSLFSLQGNVIFANFHAARIFAQKMNQARDLVTFPEQAVQAGQINAMGLIDEILHLLMAAYRKEVKPTVMIEALDFLVARAGKEEMDKILLQFVVEFPPLAVYQRQLSPGEYLQGSTDGVPNTTLALEELVMLWLANKNPAFEPYRELFNDDRLATNTQYLRTMTLLRDFFQEQPFFGPEKENLIDLLRKPALLSPNSLTGQLDVLRNRWAEIIGKHLYRLLTSMDFIKEEEKVSFQGMGPGPVPIPVYDRAQLVESEPEKFSPDREWMPRLVLIAKNSYVWLDQLSKKYQRRIQYLNEIPDEELDDLARWGFTGLWLIGLWERSNASAHIKQLCGNPEAIASAYSLAGYSIAADLGGYLAYQNLHDRAWQRGIRLASDMVPNHMGIDSNWVIEHPDWFLSLDYSPYPNYTFNGPDLSPDPNVSINIEDHYYDRTDAAVVFKRYDHRTGDTRYIYHGNDGTSMPWNDTAQLNYLSPTVREAIIQTILSVARQFPIIRFDAAMTLAKRHYSRLWFPEPGSGGAIPTRAEHGLTKEQFEQIMPVEFWREVVDRAAVEAPDTLLLAEAFWLMEGYFVRTLGMHRVYNSAFMNMLRNEDNAKYRVVLKNTLEFEPEILKRFVNFMNNPDERTAAEQFGKGDKYFGICTLLATMPGLPMFGHGQVEGFSEKYGMEYRRAYYDEQVDRDLVNRHAREIFPLLHKRYLFAGVENFLFFDFVTPDGSVNEDVYALSNGAGDEHAVVVYHNRFADARGTLHTSVGFPAPGSTAEKPTIQRRTLAEGLGLRAGHNAFLIFRDQISNLEFIRPVNEIIQKGLTLDLHAYEYHVFLDFRQVEDDAWQSYRQLNGYLNGRGVPSVQDALRELVIQPVLEPFRQLANPAYWQYLLLNRTSAATPVLPASLLPEAGQKLNNLIAGIGYLNPALRPAKDLAPALQASLKAALTLETMLTGLAKPGVKAYQRATTTLLAPFARDSLRWYPLFAWIFLKNLAELDPENGEQRVLSWLDEWQFGRALRDAFQSAGMREDQAQTALATVRILLEQQDWYKQAAGLKLSAILDRWLSSADVRQYLKVNRFQEVLWFNQEAFEQFVWWMGLCAIMQTAGQEEATQTELVEVLLAVDEFSVRLTKAQKTSEFQLEKLMKAVRSA